MKEIGTAAPAMAFTFQAPGPLRPRTKIEAGIKLASHVLEACTQTQHVGSGEWQRHP